MKTLIALLIVSSLSLLVHSVELNGNSTWFISEKSFGQIESGHVYLGYEKGDLMTFSENPKKIGPDGPVGIIFVEAFTYGKNFRDKLKVLTTPSSVNDKIPTMSLNIPKLYDQGDIPFDLEKELREKNKKKKFLVIDPIGHTFEKLHELVEVLNPKTIAYTGLTFTKMLDDIHNKLKMTVYGMTPKNLSLGYRIYNDLMICHLEHSSYQNKADDKSDDILELMRSLLILSVKKTSTLPFVFYRHWKFLSLKTIEAEINSELFKDVDEDLKKLFIYSVTHKAEWLADYTKITGKFNAILEKHKTSEYNWDELAKDKHLSADSLPKVEFSEDCDTQSIHT